MTRRSGCSTRALSLSLQYDQRIQIRTTLALGEGLCGNAALERKPIRVNHVGSDPRYIRCMGAPDIESKLVVPLIVKDRLLGVLDLESLEPNAFTQDHEQMLTTLATSLSSAPTEFTSRPTRWRRSSAWRG